MIDDCCRKNLCLIADTNYWARIARELDVFVRIYGKPTCIVMDRRGSEIDLVNRSPRRGTEFTSCATLKWAKQKDVS